MNAIDQRTLDEVLDTQKAETRRAETRRSSTLGSKSLQIKPSGAGSMAPLPPMPIHGAEGARPAPLPLPTVEPGAGAPVLPVQSQPGSPQQGGDRPGLQQPGMNAPHHRGNKQGLDWLDGK